MNIWNTIKAEAQYQLSRLRRSKGWTFRDQEKALAQGWGLFDADGVLQLQRNDDLNRFPCDMIAWAHVVETAEHCPLARKAMMVLQDQSPAEYSMVVDWIGARRGAAA